MGRVIKGFFGGERARGEGAVPSEDGVVQEQDHSREAPIAIRAQKVCLEIVDYLTSLAGEGPSAEVLATAANTWKNLSNEELVLAAENSTPADWQKYPGRYEALLREINKRFPEI